MKETNPPSASGHSHPDHPVKKCGAYPGALQVLGNQSSRPFSLGNKCRKYKIIYPRFPDWKPHVFLKHFLLFYVGKDKKSLKIACGLSLLLRLKIVFLHVIAFHVKIISIQIICPEYRLSENVCHLKGNILYI